MQRDPGITMAEAKRLLMTGTHVLNEPDLGSMVGTGELDIIGTLVAQERAFAEDFPTASPDHSRLVWAEEFAYPGGKPALRGFLLLRDKEDLPTRASAQQLSLEVLGPGTVTTEDLGVGLVGVTVRAAPESAGQTLTVAATLDGRPLSSSTFVIERDPALAAHGFELVGGTCSQRVGPVRPWSAFAMALLLSALLRRRRLREQH
jgi:hypothetical protein